MKILVLVSLVVGVLAILFSGYYGILFATTAVGPAVKGLVGGLVPTFFAVGGTLLVQFSWKMFAIRSYDDDGRADIG